ncbi:MAG: hypothetical protein EAZ86_19365 [Oscillatoriales cyanobacterium]|nr:hypothetical protein [Microcoleus sp. PH2017_17_BER_D_A]TAE66798.1 MAG: hypothetical protein EAZ86_19365 [Oscillatoriales cyanobacterium]TAG60317.1 MAG: hypothetical protein EAZ28_08015 [Oscillatoriales cyanobacterium]
MPLVNLQPSGALPPELAWDSEVSQAITNHEAKTDPHPTYLTQAEGDGRYRQSGTALTDADIPSAIARDTETTEAITAHEAKTDPHPTYLTQTEGNALYPQFKRAVFTQNLPASANGMNAFPHNLTAAQVAGIQGFTAFATVYPGTISEIRIHPGGAVAPWVGGNFFYSIDVGPKNITLRTSTNSINVLGLPVKIVVDYS